MENTISLSPVLACLWTEHPALLFCHVERENPTCLITDSKIYGSLRICLSPSRCFTHVCGERECNKNVAFFKAFINQSYVFYAMSASKTCVF